MQKGLCCSYAEVYEIVNNVTADAAFMQDMDRAARSLRAAVSAALMQGISERDVCALVAAGLNDVRDFPLTHRSQARGAALDFHPTGEDIPPDDVMLEPGDGPADADGYRFPRLHPLVGSRGHAA